jgi:uncharacterized protein
MSEQQPNIKRARQDMIAGMTPILQPETFIFCTSTDDAVLAAAIGKSFALVRETEGVTLVLALPDAQHFGFDTSLPMARIVLEVFSALDGIGLTAAVATALADEGISCNVIAAYHHDHIFVPKDHAEQALRILQAVQKNAAGA